MSSETSRIRREKQTIKAMIGLYCRDLHSGKDTLCEECTILLNYAHRRLDSCPFHEKKPTCNHCTVHCYSQSMRERVTAVMRYAGPRMLLRHPLLTLGHLLDKLRKIPELPRRRRS